MAFILFLCMLLLLLPLLFFIGGVSFESDTWGMANPMGVDSAHFSFTDICFATDNAKPANCVRSYIFFIYLIIFVVIIIIVSILFRIRIKEHPVRARSPVFITFTVIGGTIQTIWACLGEKLILRVFRYFAIPKKQYIKATYKNM